MHLITTHIFKRKPDLSRSTDIAEFLDEKFPSGHPNLWAKDFLYGLDDHETLAMATKVNMILRRDGNTHVYCADGLAPLDGYRAHRLKGISPPEESPYQRRVASGFDVVVSNPPFSITLDPHTERNLKETTTLSGTRNAENLLLERWYQLLKPGGRLGVVLPESFLGTQENLDARLFLVLAF